MTTLTADEYAALMDILQRHVAGRLSTAEAFALDVIMVKMTPPITNDLAPPIVDPPRHEAKGEQEQKIDGNPEHSDSTARPGVSTADKKDR